MTEETRNIIRLLQKQDKGVIAELYDRYGDALYGIIFRIVQSESLAKDVLQECFIKIWKKGANYDETKGTLFTWMLNIARNTAIDKTRSASFRRKQTIQALDDNVYRIGTTEIKPEHIGLKNMLEQLDPKYREVLDLVYFNGYTHKEVQEQLDIPLGSVKSRLRIGLRELRKIFDVSNIVLFIEIIFKAMQL